MNMYEKTQYDPRMADMQGAVGQAIGYGNVPTPSAQLRDGPTTFDLLQKYLAEVHAMATDSGLRLAQLRERLFGPWPENAEKGADAPMPSGCIARSDELLRAIMREMVRLRQHIDALDKIA